MVLGGNSVGALTYLKRATVSDSSYIHARLDLARAYIKRGDIGEARRELGIILSEVVDGKLQAKAICTYLVFFGPGVVFSIKRVVV